MDYIMFAKVCIIFVFILILLDALRKVQAWREFHENYDAIIEKFPKIQEILNAKEDSEGKICLNGYRLNYTTKEELLIKYELFISSTMRLYEEIKEYSLISKNLKEKNSELIDIDYQMRMKRWKNSK